MKPDTIYCGDALTVLRTWPDESIDCCVTSPPYWGLRNYGVEGQVGLEPTPEEYVEKLVTIFREVKRVLKKEGTLWLNLGDTYCGTGNKGECKDPKNPNGRNGQAVAVNRKVKGLKPKDLVGIPWRVAFALQAQGWYLRSDIIWYKPNAMPESVKDRPTKAHEYIFLLAKSERYYYDADAIKEKARKPHWTFTKAARLQRNQASGGAVTGGCGDKVSQGPYRNKRTVWEVATKPFKEAHFATFPPDLIKPCILAGCPVDGIVLDPFMGSGTTALVARSLQRHYAGIELNPEYVEMAKKRLAKRMIWEVS